MADDQLVEISDEELTALALAADPEQTVPDDAVPFDAGGERAVALLPDWYMPPPAHQRGTFRTIVMVFVAVALILIDVAGFCVTFGFPEFVWK